jgi:protein-disulfide isomerase
MSERTGSRWQSIIETLALVVVALAVARMAIVRPTSAAPVGRASAAPARRPDPPLPTDPIALTGAQITGSQTAKVALVIYSDFQCPYCGKFARETMPALQENYVRSGKVLLAFRQMPLPMHQFAQKAAEASECAGRQGKFWPFHDQLFANQQALDVESLKDRARTVGLDLKGFATCLDGETVGMVKTDRDSADPLGISGTPTFLAGRILPNGRVKVTERFTGAVPFTQFQGILDRLAAGSPSIAPK